MKHWQEYLAEALGLGLFMVSAGIVATALDSPNSPLHALIANADLRRVLAGVAMGLTAIGLIYSPWGKRSGAHLNPAVTLAFLRLKKIQPRDAAFYVAAQFSGGLIGVLLVAGLLGPSFADTPVSFAATMPGPRGVTVAFLAELVISFVLLFTILQVASHPRHSERAGLVAGVLVALYISVEAPLSGMSMNPARSFASAAPGAFWQNLWIYFVAPPLGMLLATQVYLSRHRAHYAGCAKLVHDPEYRCIHCGHDPAPRSAS
ncbi:MAG: aquaporin [Pseudomonadota bacterium]